MRKTDITVKNVIEYIENKQVLEVACGTADFSISATKYAEKVYCIDLDDFRLKEKSLQGAEFRIMDAAEMSFPDRMFDTVVLYNAFYHVHKQWNEIENECKRVLKDNGCIIIISTWSLDHGLLMKVFKDEAHQDGDFLTVMIRK